MPIENNRAFQRGFDNPWEGKTIITASGVQVGEADAGGQHGVGGVFGELGAFHVHDAGAFVVAVEGGVELAHGGEGKSVV